MYSNGGASVPLVGNQQARHPQWLMSWCLDGVCDTLKGSMSLEWSLTVLFVALWLLPTPHSYSSLLSTLGGTRDSWASLAKSHTAGAARHSLTCSNFPPSVNHGSKRSHLALSCATSGGDDSGKVKRLLLPSTVYSVSGVFVPVMYWNFYAGNLDFRIEAMGDYLRSFSPGALSI